VKDSANNVVFWLNEDDLSCIPTSAYWNDEEKETDKVFSTVTENSDELWRYLQESTTFYEQYEAVLRFANDLGLKTHGTGVDVAAGVCWTTALLSQITGVQKVYAIDMSKHRLLSVASLVFHALDAEESKIIRAFGSFYDIRLSSGSVYFCLMSQAFHHADNPHKLLSELHRILNPGGCVLVFGETPIYPLWLLKKWFKNIIKMIVPASFYASKPVYKLFPSFEELFPPDSELGDHYYRIHDYKVIFEACGFVLHSRRIGRDTLFVGVKKG